MCQTTNVIDVCFQATYLYQESQKIFFGSRTQRVHVILAFSHPNKNMGNKITMSVVRTYLYGQSV